jgi:hypothetical protein
MDRQAILSKFISTQDYKKDSPDKNRPMNVIPSNQITMSDVEFPVIGVDNLGNKIVMQPGRDYTFPGDYVVETPITQKGGWLDSYQKGGVIDDPLKMPAFLQKWGYKPKKETTVDKNYFQNLKEFGIPDEPKVVRDNVVQVKPTPPHKETIPYDPLYKFNPKNWGVPDYTHFGSRDKAYIEARKAGEKEFMWNNNRFNTLNSGTPTQQFNMYGNTNAMVMSKADDKTKEKIIKNSFVGNSMDAEELERRFTLNTLVGTPSYKHGATHPTQEEAYAKFRKQPLEKSKKELMDEYRKISRIRPSYNPFTNTIYGDDITAEEAHAYRNTEKSEIISFIKDYIKYPFFTEDQQLAGYTNRDHFEFDTHRIVEPVLESYLSGEIEKEDIPIYIKKLREQNQKYLSNKNNLKNTFNTNDLKLFYPYTEKSNKYKIQRLQKILSEKGYKLPKSTKEDGTFDGVWGEETETALNDYRKKINSKYQNGGWLDSYQKGGVIDDPLKMPAFLQKWGYSPKKETTVDKNYFQNLKEFGIPDEPTIVRDNVVQVKPTPPHKETIPYDPLYKFNPKNWGVPDYTHFGSFDKAYIEARKAGEKEFMWNRNRFNTQNSGTSQQQWNMYKNTDALLNSDANENTKKAIITASVKGYDVDADYLDRRLRVNKLAGSPNYLNTAQSKIDKTKYALAIGDIQPKEQGTFLRNVETDDNFKNEVKIRSYYNPVTNTIKGKNYISEEAHGYRNEQSSEILSFLKSYIKYPYFSESGQLEGYNNPDHYEFDTHQIVEPVLQGYIDGNIEEEEIPKYINNIRKHAGDNEKMILNYPFGKNSDKKTITLLQNELVNNLGYTLPKSTKKDGSFDGVWGEETETALNDYRKKINSKYQNGGEANWLNKYK